MKIPNILTFARFLLIPFIGLLLYSGNPNLVLLSVPVFIICIITDYADGEIARKYNMKSVFGTFFDPLVDKMLILTLLIIFVDFKLLPVWMVLLIVFREFLVTGIRQVCSKPGKVVGANWMGKSKFGMQSFLVIYIQLVFYFDIAGTNIMLFNSFILFTHTLAYYFALVVTLLSLAFAFNFLYWHKDQILKDL